jgi:hypothetical protein
MKGTLCESAQWATGLAAKLRFLQAGLAEESTEARERLLHKEIARALKPLPAEKRQQCLEVLAGQFPVPEPFEARCRLEAEQRKLATEKDAALHAVAERDSALAELEQRLTAQLEAERQKLLAQRDAARKTVAERDAAVNDLQGQLAAHAAQLEALGTERDALLEARHENAARMERMAEEHRQELAAGSGETLGLLQARDQALVQVEETRARYEAQLKAAKKERDTIVRERDEIVRVRQEEAARTEALHKDPGAVADLLLALIPDATSEQISAFVPKMQETGLFPTGGEPAPLRVPQELRERLKKIAAGRNLDSLRGLRALDILIEFTSSLDQLVWQVWKGVAPKTILHAEAGPYGDFKKCLGPYLTGDSEVSNEQLKQVVEKTRKLAAGLLTAMGNVGESSAATLRQRFAPTEIKKLADKEPGLLDSVEKKCWRKYNELFIQSNGPALEKEILNNIRKYTEKLVLGADAANVET